MSLPAPLSGSHPPFRPGGFATIAGALDYAAGTSAELRFFSSRGVVEHTLSYHELRVQALRVAEYLSAQFLAAHTPAASTRMTASVSPPFSAASAIAGMAQTRARLERGDRIALIGETSPGFLALFYGCQYAGLVPCPLPFITYVGGKDAYVTRLAQLARAARAQLICAPEKLQDIAGEAARAASIGMLSFERCVQSDPAPASQADRCADLVPLAADELAYVQFSSGSTALPKGVPITQAAVSCHARIILQHGMGLSADDRAFSWLPFYHDMGLFGFSVAPLFGQCPVDYLAPASFARRPNLWVELMAQQRSTISYAPSFGYRLATQRFDGRKDLDLSALRIAGIGGDMIRADVLRQFADRFASVGFNPAAFMPSYGMAEATLAISFAPGLTTDRVDSHKLSVENEAVPVASINGDEAPDDAGMIGAGAVRIEKTSSQKSLPREVREFVICGPVIPDHQLCVVDANGRALAQRQVGRILVRGPSLMAGYDDNPEASANVIGADGFMDTGDLGYLIGDQLVVTGRTKDVMHLRGRNIWPEDVEWVAERVDPLRPGDTAAIALVEAEGEDQLICLVQSALDDKNARTKLQQDVRAAISTAIGIECEVVLVAPKSLTYTSSGKLARGLVRQAYLTGALTPVS